MRAFLLSLVLALTLPFAALAVFPDEVLDDPVLEARAREMSKDLRCLVCRNESIDESNAPLARDLRLLVRERLVAGDTDAEVMDFVVARYGEYVLLRPLQTGTNRLLWAAGPAGLGLGLVLAFVYLRRRRPGAAQTKPPQPLSEAEQKRLAELLQE